MANRSNVYRSLPAVLMTLLSTCPLRSAISDGGGPVVAVATVMAGKRACDRAVIGFAQKTDDAFERWKEASAAAIAQATKYRYGGKSFEEFIQCAAKTELQKPQVDIENECEEVLELLQTPVRPSVISDQAREKVPAPIRPRVPPVLKPNGPPAPSAGTPSDSENHGYPAIPDTAQDKK